MNVIDCEKMTKTYGKTKALNNLSLTIETNKITGLIGRNGAGKTTLLKIIAGLIRETSGEIQVFSERPFNNLFVSANTIFISEQLSLPTSLNLMEILEEASRFYENWNWEVAQGLFAYFSFNPKQRHSNLSKGKKSTFNMIIGLAARCALTIFDEPTSGMDTAVRKDFYRALLKDYLAHPRTIILSSHHLEEIEHLLEDILLIHNGKTLLHLPIEEVKDYAIGLTGETMAVKEFIKSEDVIYRNEILPGTTYAVVRNHPELHHSKLAQRFEVTAVQLNDLYVYLTNETAGGIDDVFNRN